MATYPTLRFTPQAYGEWRALCLAAETEIGAFGWTGEADPLLVHSLWVPKQVCTPATVEREPDQLAACMRAGFDAGLHPGLCTAVWLHTHPGSSATPSGTDEQYWRDFSVQHGHVMGIMSKSGETFARLALRDKYICDLDIKVEIAWDVSAAKAIVAEKVSAPAPREIEWQPREYLGADHAPRMIDLHDMTRSSTAVSRLFSDEKPLSKREFKRLRRLREMSEDCSTMSDQDTRDLIDLELRLERAHHVRK